MEMWLQALGKASIILEEGWPIAGQGEVAVQLWRMPVDASCHGGKEGRQNIAKFRAEGVWALPCKF